jgi:hypothetical protein
MEFIRNYDDKVNNILAGETRYKNINPVGITEMAYSAYLVGFKLVSQTKLVIHLALMQHQACRESTNWKHTLQSSLKDFYY